MQIIKYPDILLDSLENGHMIIDKDFRVSYWNRWLSINTQIRKEHIIGKSLEEFYPDINYKVLHRKIKTALSIGTPTFYDINSSTKFLPIHRNKITTSSLKLMQQQVTVSPYIIAEDKVMISVYDISELFETKLCLKKEMDKVITLNEELEAEQDIIDRNVMMMRTSSGGKITYVSTLFCEVFDFKKEELLGNNITLFRLQNVPTEIYKNIWDTLKEKKFWSGELKLKTSGGEEKWMQLRITPVLDTYGDIQEYSVLYHDITNEKLLEQLYITDPLTKLHNRAYFDKIISFVAKHQRKSDIDFVLVLADLDHFKSINDTYGHQSGDEALVHVAGILKKSLRENDLVARWGGEEFVIMLKDVTLEEASHIIDKVRKNIHKSVFKDDIRLSASFGYTKYITPEDAKETFKRVDDALYEAKKGGRNRAVLK